MDFINLLQWNCKSLILRKVEIIHLINKFKPLIFAISETWMKPGKRFRIPGFSCLRDDRIDGYGGSAILVSRSFPFSQLSLPSYISNINAVAVRFCNITFLSIYIPHPHSSLISDLHSIFSCLPLPVVVMGDFNAHHTAWGCHYVDGFAPLLLDLIDEFDFCFVNDGTSTRRTYPSQNPKSAVDLTLCSPSLVPSLSWNVLTSTHGSDHFPIFISLSKKASPFPILNPLLPYYLHKANWPNFKSFVDFHSTDFPVPNDENALSCYNQFVNIIQSAANAHIPVKVSGIRKWLSPPWWDAECSEAIKKRKKAEQDYRFSMSQSNFIAYKKIAATTKRLLKKKREQDGLNFVKH